MRLAPTIASSLLLAARSLDVLPATLGKDRNITDAFGLQAAAVLSAESSCKYGQCTAAARPTSRAAALGISGWRVEGILTREPPNFNPEDFVGPLLPRRSLAPGLHADILEGCAYIDQWLPLPFALVVVG